MGLKLLGRLLRYSRNVWRVRLRNDAYRSLHYSLFISCSRSEHAASLFIIHYPIGAGAPYGKRFRSNRTEPLKILPKIFQKFLTGPGKLFPKSFPGGVKGRRPLYPSHHARRPAGEKRMTNSSVGSPLRVTVVLGVTGWVSKRLPASSKISRTKREDSE